MLATALKRRRDVLAHNVVEFGTAFVTCLESSSADPAAAGLAASDPGLPTELADLASQAGHLISHQALKVPGVWVVPVTGARC